MARSDDVRLGSVWHPMDERELLSFRVVRGSETRAEILDFTLPKRWKRTKSSGLMNLAFGRKASLRWLLLGGLALGCGHPASAQECEELADRVTQLELASSPVGLDAETAKEQLERTRTWVKESQLKSCVGRRITDRAMQCVRATKNAQ